MTADQERRWLALSPWHTRWDLGMPSGGWADDGTRVRQFLDRFGPRPGRVLELSCLEGAHTLHLARHCDSVLALEGRPGNVARTRLVAEVLGAANVGVRLADLEGAKLARLGRFDAVFCVGILYHLRDPRRLVRECAAAGDRLFLWTHYDPGGGRWHDEDARGNTSGLSPRSFRPARRTLLSWLADAGYFSEVVADDPGHPNGPAVTLACRRYPRPRPVAAGRPRAVEWPRQRPREDHPVPNLSKKKSSHITNLATAVVRLLEDVAALKALVADAQDLHYSDPDPGGLADADFTEANAYLDAAIYKQVVGTLLALDSQMAAPGASGAPSVYAVLRQMKP